MGFNISGIVTSRNIEKELDNLEKELNCKLEFEKEIDFETASSNWKDEDICDIYFTDNGTLVFLNHSYCLEPIEFNDTNTLTFAFSETSMAFSFHLFENGKLRRSRAVVEERELQGYGERLDIEYSPIDISEIIWSLIETTLGKSFWYIDLSEKAKRYKILPLRKNELPTQEKQPDTKSNVSANIYKLKIALKVYKISKWVIICGIVLAFLDIIQITDNWIGVITILLGGAARKLSSMYMKRFISKNN